VGFGAAAALIGLVTLRRCRSWRCGGTGA